MMLLWFVCSVSASAASISINGWWGIDEEGCSDTDNQNRIALGKWKSSKGSIKFGEGKESIGLYDGKCVLSNKKESSTEITYQASCDLAEENYSGAARVNIKDSNNITLFYPGGDSEGTNLVRCDATEQPKAKNIAIVEPTKKTTVDYFIYKNSEAGFIIDLPEDVLYPEGESENGMEQAFKSSDKETVLFTYGEENKDHKTIKELYADGLNPSDKNEKVFTYKRLGKSWFVVSGYHNNNIFYQKTILSKTTGSVISFYFEHPKSQKPFYNNITVRMSKSFKEL
ncbi:hypothetical protein [Thiofilum flexile]|uniref:hypothetical protein n=1 Tax=Thiofilum flexile TaxID=125627 RepID=UPI0013A561E7|nr:hypothetical protein [Thiofilum flexile]